MNNFSFQVPTKVFFGKDCIKHLPSVLSMTGSKVMVVYGGGSVVRSGLLNHVKQLLAGKFELFECGGIEPNPKMASIRRGVSICKEERVEMILALGGGSVIDASKAIAAGACVDFDPWDFFGGERKAIEKALPIYTVVTMASTGSEMTCGAVISNEETREKLGRSGFSLFPKASFLDPVLTFSVPPFQTACGAVDIFSHVFENYFNKDSNFYFLNRMMEGAMKTVVENSRIVLKDPSNYDARANLLWSAPWAINGLFAAGSKQVWSCHPIEHELSGHYDVTHGLGLAVIMPKWLKYCLEKDSLVEQKIVEFGNSVFGTRGVLDTLTSFERYLYDEMNLPEVFSKSEMDGFNAEQLAALICKNGPVKGYCELDASAVQAILQDCVK